MYKDQVLVQERALIKETVQQFDQEAEVFLFGPGTKYKGKQMDIYIKSKLLRSSQQQKIKQKLNHDLLMPHIGMICKIDDEKLLEDLKVIGLAI